MQSIIDILHKNFQKDHTNSRRFLGFPGVVDTLLTATEYQTMPRALWFNVLHSWLGLIYRTDLSKEHSLRQHLGSGIVCHLK